MALTRCEQTDGRTDGQTGRRIDRVIPTYPLKLCLRGGIKRPGVCVGRTPLITHRHVYGVRSLA